MPTYSVDEHIARSVLRLTLRVVRGSLLFVRPEAGSRSVATDSYPLNGGMSVAANLRRALASNPDATGQIDSVAALIDAPVMLVPTEEYREEESAELFRYAFTSTDGMDVMASVMPSESAVALAGVNKDLRRVLSDNFAEVLIMPLMQPLWRYLHRRSFTGKGSKLFAYFHEKKMEVCAFRHTRFRYQNSFEPASVPDALYYLMGAWQQLAYKGDTDELLLLGHWPYMDELVEQSRRFVSEVHLIKAVPDFHLPAGADRNILPLDLQAYLV